MSLPCAGRLIINLDHPSAMKKIILTLQLLFILFSVSVGQRTLQIVSDTMTTHFDEAVLANEVYIAENLGFHLGKYDGDTFTTFPYPVVGGV